LGSVQNGGEEKEGSNTSEMAITGVEAARREDALRDVGGLSAVGRVVRC
jgi:hypothetical protein